MLVSSTCCATFSSPLLGLEPTTVEKAGENSTMPEDSNHHARLTPLLGTIFSCDMQLRARCDEEHAAGLLLLVFTCCADPMSNIGRRCRFHYNPLRPSGDGPRIGLPEAQQHYHADSDVTRRRSAVDRLRTVRGRLSPNHGDPLPTRRSGSEDSPPVPAGPVRRDARGPDLSAIKPTQPRTSPGEGAMRRWRSQMMAAPGAAGQDLFDGVAGMLR